MAFRWPVACSREGMDKTKKEGKPAADENPKAKEHHGLVPASTASGAVIGAIVGAIGGPPGVAIGGAIGAAAGLIAGKVIDDEDQRESAHDAELDEDIGVTTDEIGLGKMKITTIPKDEEGED